ncbi:hypothetical protein [Erythrobacter colymbi]|uniref:hypothetical protein n=1 Tax=Erythrobacter colymbi TaxID=1161202 RepID=UPI001F0A9BB4|nr:hypothetical protein [Erythrobacter colymbi]
MALLTQTAGSLVAILALAGLAWWLKLGGSPRLDSAEAVARAAGEVEDGFAPVATSYDAEGASALARDGAGRIMVIKRHGNRFAGRVLGPRARAEREGASIVIDAGEPRFGKVFLTLPEPEAWADAINRVSGAQDA